MSDPSTFQTEATDVAPGDVAAKLDAGEIDLIDVREDHEIAEGRIPGATAIKIADLSAAAADLPKDRPIVFQCAHGSRSKMAAEAFRGAGFEAYNLAGGIAAWSHEGLPMDPEGTVLD